MTITKRKNSVNTMAYDSIIEFVDSNGNRWEIGVLYGPYGAPDYMTDADIAGLQKLIEGHGRQKSLADGEAYYQESKDVDFHVRIVTGSGNARLAEMLTGDLYYLLRVYRYRSSTNPGRAHAALAEHSAIVAAIASRDSALAEARMREHLRNARASVEAKLAAESADLAAEARAATA